MTRRGWVTRGAVALLLIACAREGASPAAAPANAVEPPAATPPAATSAATNEPGSGGIGLGNFEGFDAGPDAHWVRADAAMFRGKTVNGRIPPEQIQAVVRANFGAMRKCYEDGLRPSPNLNGRV